MHKKSKPTEKVVSSTQVRLTREDHKLLEEITEKTFIPKAMLIRLAVQYVAPRVAEGRLSLSALRN